MADMSCWGFGKMSRDAADAFFAQLPDELVQEEIELLQLLKKVASLLESWLPPGVSLQSWVESRTPMEYAKDVNASRLAYVNQSTRNETLQALRRPPAAPQVRSNTGASAEGDQVPVAHVEHDSGAERFFESLPTDQLMPWEILLKASIQLSIPAPRWAKSPGKPITDIAWTSLDHFKALPYISRIMEENLPDNTSSLQQWIVMRIRDSFEIKVDDGQNGAAIRMSSDLSTEDREKATEVFLGALPTDSFTPEEEDLRTAVLNFLEERAHANPATPAKTDDLGHCPAVRQARLSALPARITIKGWCESRINDEVEFMKIEVANQKPCNVIALRGHSDPHRLQNELFLEVSHSSKRKRTG